MAYNPALILAQTFTTFGRAASYQPVGGASALPCRVIIDAADDAAQIMGVGFVQAQRKIEVRVSEVSRPSKDGKFIIDSKTMKIVAAPSSKDPDGLVWTCLCDPF